MAARNHITGWLKTEAIRIDEADLQRGMHNTESAKIKAGVLR